MSCGVYKERQSGHLLKILVVNWIVCELIEWIPIEPP